MSSAAAHRFRLFVAVTSVFLPMRYTSGQSGPAFEVASVKPNKSSDHRSVGMQFLPGGRFTATNIPIRMVIAAAYDFPFQSALLSGGPDWISSERYDIEAIAEKGSIPAGSSAEIREEKMKLMLQTLLAARFKLSIRRETKELDVYALVVSKHGPKLRKAKIKEKDCPEVPTSDGFVCHGGFMGGSGRGLHGEAVDMKDLVAFLPFFVDRPVVDKTDITGLFDINTDGWAALQPAKMFQDDRPSSSPAAENSAEQLAAPDPSRRTLFAVLEQQLGLKLESQRAAVQTFVIEHVEKPTSN